MPGQEFGRVARPAGFAGCKHKSEGEDRSSREDQRLHGRSPLSFFTMAGKVLVLAAALAIEGLGAAADPAVYRGTAQVVGPAMLSLDGKRIVLFGVDAPVKGQPCYVGAKPWDCSTASAKTLLNLVGTQDVACEEHWVDRFGRV